MPFRVVKNNLFKELFITILFNTYLPQSGNTIKRWIMDDYKEKKQEIIRLIAKYSNDLYHISFELWTSPNPYSILRVVLHYMDDSYTNQTRILTLRKLRGLHSGENIRQLLHQILKEYDLPDRLGYFITNNANSNDNMSSSSFVSFILIRFCAHHLKRRIRCLRYILNLAAKVFFFSADPNAFKIEIEVNRRFNRLKTKQQL